MRGAPSKKHLFIVVAFTMAIVGITSLTSSLPVGSAAENKAIKVKITKHATLEQGGQAVIVEVKVTCASTRHILQESLVYVVQDGYTSQFAGLPVVSDGRPHQNRIRVLALEQPFHRGQARATAYVLLYDPATGETVSGGDTEEIRID